VKPLLSLNGFILSALALLACAPFPAAAQSKTKTYTSWTNYGGTPDASQYSSLDHINRSNVSRLAVAWKYSTSDEFKYSFNPIVVDGVMYVLAKQNSIVAIDAANGRELWVHPTDPQGRLLTSRGINYWESADRSDRRLLFSMNNFLQEIDARTG
jgi:quinoprotein glucose dehydrogenase